MCDNKLQLVILHNSNKKPMGLNITFVLLLVFFFQNEATFPLVRKDYYIESLQGDLYTHQGDFLRSSKRR